MEPFQRDTATAMPFLFFVSDVRFVRCFKIDMLYRNRQVDMIIICVY